MVIRTIKIFFMYMEMIKMFSFLLKFQVLWPNLGIEISQCFSFEQFPVTNLIYISLFFTCIGVWVH